jgi:hypothetical protein
MPQQSGHQTQDEVDEVENQLVVQSLQVQLVAIGHWMIF